MCLAQRRQCWVTILHEARTVYAVLPRGSRIGRRNESAVSTDGAVRIVEIMNLELQSAAQRPAMAGIGERHADRQIGDLAGRQAYFASTVQLEWTLAERYHVLPVLLSLVDDLEAVHVLDLPLRVFAIQGAVLGDIQRKHRPSIQRPDEGA